MTPYERNTMLKAIKLFVGIIALVYLMNFAMLAINTSMLSSTVSP